MLRALIVFFGVPVLQSALRQHVPPLLGDLAIVLLCLIWTYSVTTDTSECTDHNVLQAARCTIQDLQTENAVLQLILKHEQTKHGLHRSVSLPNEVAARM